MVFFYSGKSMRRPLIALLLSLLAACDSSSDTPVEQPLPAVLPIVASIETPNESEPSDMDDPALWVHPIDKSKSLVIAAAKLGGLRVYDLNGKEIQKIAALLDSKGKPAQRFNNVDVQYNFDLNGKRIDIAVASDRLGDKLRIWKIDASDPKGPLLDISDPAMPRIFPTRPDAADRATKTIANPNDGKNTAYGLALYKSGEKIYALVNQNNEAMISQLELVANADNTIGFKPVKNWMLAYSYKGIDLTQKNDTDPTKDFSPQFEGMVVDQQSGILYAGQEDVGIWRINLKTGVAENKPFYETRTFDSQSKIARDVEGLTIWYGNDGKGYLIASSQGKAHGKAPQNPTLGLDDTFAVFSRDAANAYLGSFSIEANKDAKIDAVQECDGAEVSSVALPGFPYGILMTQDGYNDDLNNLDGVVKASNIKFTPWHIVADRFLAGKLLKESNYDPRKP
jgi:3-phytase